MSQRELTVLRVSEREKMNSPDVMINRKSALKTGKRKIKVVPRISALGSPFLFYGGKS